MSHAQDEVRLSTGDDGQVVIDGPALSPFSMSGRQRAWLTLALILVIVFALARILGFL